MGDPRRWAAAQGASRLGRLLARRGRIRSLPWPLSGWTGAALALLPPGGVQDAVEDGELYPMHVEALYEVVNVLSSVLNTPGAPHCKLHALHAPGDPLPVDVLGIASALGNRIDLGVTVATYGKGRLSIVLPF